MFPIGLFPIGLFPTQLFNRPISSSGTPEVWFVAPARPQTFTAHKK